MTHFPKQFANICGDKNLFQQTVSRIELLAKEFPVAEFLVVTNLTLRNFIRKEDFHTKFSTIVEPCQRNTAAAICSAAVLAYRKDKEALLLISPSDHAIKNLDKFIDSCHEGVKLAQNGYLVTFGLIPTKPETGYGYIQRGKNLSGNAFEVSNFKEKPNFEVAEKYIESGNYLWNSGIFIFKASTLIDEFKKIKPDILEYVEESIDGDIENSDILLKSAAYQQIENISIDYAIMEKTKRAAVVSCQVEWTDLGVWKSVYEFMEKDQNKNVCQGNVLTVNTTNSLLKSEGRTLAAVGLQNICVVETNDAILVSSMESTQNVKEIVSMLKENKKEANGFVTRPWGGYESLVSSSRFQVKRIVVKPGQKLSLQKHFHRSEHWIVVEGCAEVQIQDSVRNLVENQSAYIDAGEVHRLANPGKIDLVVIEVQVGSYLGEDDIIRLDDVYNRV